MYWFLLKQSVKFPQSFPVDQIGVHKSNNKLLLKLYRCISRIFGYLMATIIILLQPNFTNCATFAIKSIQEFVLCIFFDLLLVTGFSLVQGFSPMFLFCTSPFKLFLHPCFLFCIWTHSVQKCVSNVWSRGNLLFESGPLTCLIGKTYTWHEYRKMEVLFKWTSTNVCL